MAIKRVVKKKIIYWKDLIFAFIYEKKIRGNAIYSVEKYRVFKVTLFKRVTSITGIKSTYLRFFSFNAPLPVIDSIQYSNDDNFADFDLPIDLDRVPLVSVIVPNYNHAMYLEERLDSIYQQTYKNIEVILLDDASSDNSVQILKDYQHRYPDITRLIVNKENSGKVFLQWNKGLELAKGEYIWIAESDDYCDRNFLEELLLGLQHQSVMLSFARSVFVKNGKKIWSLEEYLKDLPLSWGRPFIMSAHTLVEKAFAIKNVIPNVSSAVFRNIGNIPDEITAIWQEMSLCGDWLFYLWLIRGGAVSYTNEVTNYYRIHEKSTSLKIQKTLYYYAETHKISCFIAQRYAVSLSVYKTVKDNLIAHYMAHHHVDNYDVVEKIYDIEVIKDCTKYRLPNVLVCGYSLTQGGGEIFPIYLANELKKQGLAVTYMDFRGTPCDEEIRRKLNVNIPLIELSNVKYLQRIISSVDAEIIHTHEGTIDHIVACVIKNKQKGCKHIITLHGMYEAVPKTGLSRILSSVISSCSCFVYIADKNLMPFKGILDPVPLQKIGNALPKIPIAPHKREELGIEANAFCLTLVSRARVDKGWLEAIEAVKIANAESSRPIHLILIGDGKCYDILKIKKLPSYIHLLGRKNDVRNYFAMSDIGLLPSRFKGESFPLVIIECLMSGTPVVASDVGEVRNMLTDEEGLMAGVLFNLNNWTIPIAELAKIILALSKDNDAYGELKTRVEKVAAKFDIGRTAKRYIDVYNKALGISRID
ncbi:glycosyltransferase [Bacteroidaceae bacterium HV4-6-C5C]|nr:glycosyltransferase [Bacteroidaceae bacterium HV4-6-C5C]